MKPVLRKVLIVLAIVLVVIAGLTLWIMRGRPAEHSVAELSGPDPVLVEQDPEWFPSVSLAKPLGWPDNARPQAAAGLTVSRFASGLNHPRRPTHRRATGRVGSPVS
jgi:hypothetical protein